jgi:hypothetical protein
LNQDVFQTVARVAISFGNKLFGGSSDSSEIDSYDLADDIAFSAIDNDYNHQYSMNCEFDQCGIISSMESADGKKT